MPRTHSSHSLFTTGYGPCPSPIGRPTVTAAICHTTFAMSLPALLTAIPPLQDDTSNWAIFAMHFQEAMEAMHRWGYFNRTNTCPVPKDAAHPTNAESEAIKEWKHEDVMVQGLLSLRLPDRIFIRLITHKTAKG